VAPIRRTALWLALGTVALLLALGVGVPLIPDHDGIAHARHASAHRRSVGRSRGPARPRSLSPTRRLPTVVVTIAAHARMRRVPRSFFGLSTEYWSIPWYERHAALFERALALLHVDGDGPLIMRIGGDSADHTFWDPRRRAMPWWAFELTPEWVREIRTLVRREQLRLILDLNLVTDTPRMAARWARAAETELPRGSIVGFEVGNEPDIYAHWFWMASIGRSRLAAAVLPRALSAGIYTRDFRSYSQALATIAPRVPLVGPALANPQRDARWLTNLIAARAVGLGLVSAHRYPFSACVTPRSHAYPTLARLLSEPATAGLARTLRRAVGDAHHARLRFRLTEMNSVTCGGLRGVSDAFATALWAPDALFELLRAGVDGVNVHLRANTINAPFALTAQGLRARPLMYGLLMFIRTLGRDPWLVPTHLRSTPSLHVKVWAVRVRGGLLHVLVIDKGGRSAHVELRLPAAGPAHVVRLLAPSPRSASGVRLGGRYLNAAGDWTGSPAALTIARGGAGYELTVPRWSEALLTARLAMGSGR
jgi:hypothetical protein